MDYAKESLKLHEQWKGKIEVVATVPVSTQGRPVPGLHPRRCPALPGDSEGRRAESYELTRRHNLCAVITDGTAVLGLGDIGPEAGMPVMEGKCVLFKAFGDVDAFPLCVKTQGRGRVCQDRLPDLRQLRRHQPGGYFRAPLL